MKNMMQIGVFPVIVNHISIKNNCSIMPAGTCQSLLSLWTLFIKRNPINHTYTESHCATSNILIRRTLLKLGENSHTKVSQQHCFEHHCFSLDLKHILITFFAMTAISFLIFPDRCSKIKAWVKGHLGHYSDLWFPSRRAEMAYSQIRLKILPSVRCLFDKLVQVKVEGLAPHRPVELRSKLVDDRGVTFKASALYKADETGQVDVSRAPSLGGSYTGVEPMGLFWSMAPETPHNKYVKKNVLSPTVVELEALSGDTGEILASETNERGYMTEGMKRIPVQEGRIRGVLFIPPGMSYTLCQLIKAGRCRRDLSFFISRKGSIPRDRGSVHVRWSSFWAQSQPPSK